MTETSVASQTVGKLPYLGFQIQLVRSTTTTVIGDVHLGQPFDLRAAIHNARDVAADEHGDDSLEVSLLDQFLRDITSATPISLVLGGLKDQQLAERLIEVLTAVQPYISRAIINSDDTASQRLDQAAGRIAEARRSAAQSQQLEYGID